MKDVRMIFGFALLVLLGSLVAVIALGHVEEKTSFGLQPLEGCLMTMAGGFAQWAFGSREEKGRDKDEPDNR